MNGKGFAVVTGGSGGIGLEIARLLAADGCSLALAGRDSGRLGAAARELERAWGVKVLTFVRDLTEPGAGRELYREIRTVCPPADILVNNAGAGAAGGFFDLPVEKHTALIGLDVTSLTELARLFGRDMRERGSGRILNVASVAAFCPGPNMAVYYASKAYVLSLSLAMRRELAGTGVTVTALCPGPTATNFNSAASTAGSFAFKLFKPARAESVARAGYTAMKKGKAMQLCGLSTHLINLGSRLAPRKLLASSAARINGL